MKELVMLIAIMSLVQTVFLFAIIFDLFDANNRLTEVLKQLRRMK